MNAQAQFEVIVSNLANIFLQNSIQTPQRILPVAEKIAIEAQALVKENPAEQLPDLMAQNLLKMMDRSLFLVDLFAKSVTEEKPENLKEDQLLAVLDQVVGKSQEDTHLIELLANSIKANLERGIAPEKIYYENALVEYVSSLMEISALQQLAEKKDLLNALKPTFSDGSNEMPYNIFHEISNSFKRAFAMQFYQYETVVQIMNQQAEEK